MSWSLLWQFSFCIVASAGKSCLHKSNCRGRSCDDWVQLGEKSLSCSNLESKWHCDCTACVCGKEPNTCTKQDGCFGHSCAFWSDTHKLTCNTLENFYKCDCHGCGCKTPFGAYKLPENGKWKKIPNANCISKLISSNLRIGEGFVGNHRQTFDRWTVNQCKTKCAKHPECKGFNYDNNLKVCRYKRADTSHRVTPYKYDDCYLFERSATTIPSITTIVPTTRQRVTQRLRTDRPPRRCNEVVCGGKSHCIDSSTGFSCFCAVGWIGGGLNTVCQDVNECVGVNCGGKSVCFNGLNLYTCLCADGWRGGGDNKVCTANTCTCKNGKGAIAAQCPIDGASKCVSCNHGYDLQMDDTCVDTCATKTCSGHGKCYAGKCYCDAHYSGSDCEVAPDPCAAVRCGRHGRCFDGTCFCEDSYTGDNCEIAPSVVVVHGRE